MNREILFRGKRVDNGEWAFGAFCPDVLEINSYGKTIAGETLWADGWIRKYCAEERHMKMYEVERDTVGQYTGLTDRAGKRIFEGDIVAWRREDILLNGAYMAHGYGSYGYKYGDELVVRWLESGFMLCRKNDTLPDIPNGNAKIDNYAFWNYHGFLEVVGNIHDNQELLEGEAN